MTLMLRQEFRSMGYDDESRVRCEASWKKTICDIYRNPGSAHRAFLEKFNMQRIPAFKSLDALRGFAARWVVMVHSCDGGIFGGNESYTAVLKE